MKKAKNHLFLSVGFLFLFILWTASLRFIDVQPIGPGGSSVGFAEMNRFFHRLTGMHLSLYILTDWLGLIPFFTCMAFASLGLTQWIKRKSIRNVDAGILILGGYYLVVMAAYLFFEYRVINFRPVLLDGRLEASYPSSTTLLTLSVMPTAMIQLNARIRKPRFRRLSLSVLSAFTVFMLAGRLISGVHWLSDIIGGALLSAGLVMLYASLCERTHNNHQCT